VEWVYRGVLPNPSINTPPKDKNEMQDGNLSEEWGIPFQIPADKNLLKGSKITVEQWSVSC